MKRSRFSDEQIIGILKEHQAGLSAVELCRKYGVSDATSYKWRSKYGGMDVPEAKRLKALEDENAKLKRLLAEAMLDVSKLKERNSLADLHDRPNTILKMAACCHGVCTGIANLESGIDCREFGIDYCAFRIAAA